MDKRMKRTFALILAAAALAVPLAGTPVLTAPAYAADQTQAARDLIDSLGAKALSTIKARQSGQLSDEAAKQDFRRLLGEQSFDIPTIAKFTLGRYWRVATPQQQAEFTELVREVIINKYADRVLNASTGSYEITGAQNINGNDTAVNMLIKPTAGAPISFVWRVRNMKVIDLSVEGVSMSVTNRADFASVIERNGGQVQALIDALKAKR